MPAREPLTVTEHSDVEIDHPAPDVHTRDALQRELGQRLRLTWLADHRLRIRSTSWIGVVRLPDGTSIRVVPKLAGDELEVLVMLGLVGGLRSQELLRLPRTIGVSPGDDLLDLVCALLTEATSRLLAQGALRDYRAAADDLPYVRGRLDVLRQSTHHFGRVDVLGCRYETFDHDVLDNRVLREAMVRAAAVASTPVVKRRARQLHDELAELAPGPCPPAVDLERRLVYDRRNESYRVPHVWALALLNNQSVSRPFEDVGHASTVFLIDMNSLFERFVEWLFCETFASSIEVVPQYRDDSLLWSGGRRWGTVRPDLLLRKADAALAVDAKYKRYDVERVSSEDLYQLFLYARAYRGFGVTPSSLLVFPTDAHGSSERVDLRMDGTTETSVFAVGLHLPRLLDELRVPSPRGARVPDDVRRVLESAVGAS